VKVIDVLPRPPAPQPLDEAARIVGQARPAPEIGADEARPGVEPPAPASKPLPLHRPQPPLPLLTSACVDRLTEYRSG